MSSYETLAQLIAARRSVRAFKDQQVPADQLRAIFADAQRSPSWCNIQPWRVWVASGAVRERLIEGMLSAAQSQTPEPAIPFPSDYPEPYATHRKECGKALYQAMGVERGDGEARQAAWLRNFAAFGAPHVAIVGMDRRFEEYGALDLGCWLQSVLLLAEARGVATCAQASLALYPRVSRDVLCVPEEVKIICGIAMGYEDPEAAANRCRTTRQPLEDNLTFL